MALLISNSMYRFPSIFKMEASFRPDFSNISIAYFLIPSASKTRASS